ncbi:MAG TPA: sigma-70 family RNA polymerase sigma factor [Solirubrobacteraceae bacterium]|nr:sigma-70 family RNA polymerase sigma factor [Solirubrobacteraceae bacterium]
MELVAAGDARAFEVVFDRHSGPAFSLAFRICGRRAVAEDVVQEAFLSLWRAGGRYDRTRGSVRSWVLGSVHNRAIDMLRRNALREGQSVSDEGLADRFAAGERTDVEVERRERSRVMRRALEMLPADQRQVIELAYFGGFTHTEIAALLKLPQGTVKGRMRLGLAKLRSTLDDQAGALA